jgi:predicted ATPase/DNA-binding SARP family transcriptional activator
VTQPLCRIELLGGLRVRHGAEPCVRVPVRKMGMLLGYLALFLDRTHTREELEEMLWPDETPEATRTRFRQLLATLRRLFAPAPGLPLIADRTEVRLDPGSVSTDVLDFERAIAAAKRTGEPNERAEHLRRAIDLCQGELLPGYYEDWVISERRRLADAHTEALGRLALALAELGRLDAAIDFGRRAVAEDPLREEANCDLIRLYTMAGRPAEALRQYSEMERLLQREIGLAPSSAAQALVTEIRGSSATPSRPSPISFPPDTPHAPLDTGGAESAEGLLPYSKPQAGNRLPAPLTRFFGREQELSRLEEMLGVPFTGVGDRGSNAPQRLPPYTLHPPPNTRLVTLTGSGGCGKTRLARELAAQLQPAYQGAVWFVPLADLTQSHQVATALLAALTARPSPEADAVAQAAEILDRQPSLVIFDNFEHLIDGGAAVVRGLLERVSGLRCLVTSRQKLNIEGEHELPVQPLPIPERPGTPERLLEFASVQLLRDRICMVRPDFEVTSENAEAAAELCRSLEGIPLAIELAAARAQVLTPEQMLQELKERFDFLVSRRTDIPARHRTLRSAMDWSFQMLTPELQQFLARLTIFRGGWTLEAARTVCEQPDALNSLELLRERSLIAVEPQGAEMRFRMLETVRQYCAEQLKEAERRRARARHVDYFLALAEEAEPKLRGQEQVVWMDRLERDLDNLRAALDGQTWEASLRIAGALWRFWYVRGYFSEGRARLTEVLGQTVGSGYTVARAKALNGAGVLACEQGEYVAARTLFEESLALFRALGDQQSIAFSLNNLGMVARHQGEYVAARTLLEESLALFRALGDKRGIAFSLLNLGIVISYQEETVAARTLYEESLALFRESGDTWGVANALIGVGMVAHEQGEYRTARMRYEEGLALKRKLGDKWGIAFSLINLGLVAHDQGEYRTARTLFEESLALKRELGDKRGIAFLLEAFAALTAAEGPAERAGQLWGAAEALRERIQAPHSPSERVEYDRKVAYACHRAGEKAFAAAWEKGRSLTLEQSIAYVLGRTASAPDPLR